KHRLERQPAPRHVLGKAGQLAQRLFYPVRLRRDEGSRAVALHQHSIPYQMLHRLAHRNAGHVDHGGEIELRREGMGRLYRTARDGGLYPALQLQIERPALRQDYGVGAEQCSRHGHGRSSLPVIYNTTLLPFGKLKVCQYELGYNWYAFGIILAG